MQGSDDKRIGFMMVRDEASLERACRDVSQLLAQQLRYADRPLKEPISAIWVGEPLPLTSLPALSCNGHGVGSGNMPQVFHSVSITGVWSVCWFHEPMDRRQLFDTLVEIAKKDAHAASTGRLIPVFSESLGELEIEQEMQWLSTHHRPRLLSPAYRVTSAGHLGPRGRPQFNQQGSPGEGLLAS